MFLTKLRSITIKIIMFSENHIKNNQNTICHKNNKKHKKTIKCKKMYMDGVIEKHLKITHGK